MTTETLDPSRKPYTSCFACPDTAVCWNKQTCLNATAERNTEGTNHAANRQSSGQNFNPRGLSLPDRPDVPAAVAGGLCQSSSTPTRGGHDPRRMLNLTSLNIAPCHREGQGGLFCVTVSYEVSEDKLVETLAQLVGLPGAVG